MEDLKSMIVCGTIAVLLIAVPAGCVVTTTHITTGRIVEAVKAGSDPMKASCAISLTTDRQICTAATVLKDGK